MSVDRSGKTPLHYAASNGQANIIHILVQNYNCNINARSHGGETPLIKAIQFSKVAAVTTML